jgi:hypothetical protein
MAFFGRNKCNFITRFIYLYDLFNISFLPHYGPGVDPAGPGVDSASNRNVYQEHFLGVKVACAYG